MLTLSFPRRAFCAAIALGMIASALSAQAPAKKVVKTQDDLPQFNYPISGTATELLQSDDATFNLFAAKVRADVNSTLRDYDIQDHATLRGLLNVRLALEILSGTENQQALTTIDQIRALEDKPDAKLLSGLRAEAILKARISTGQSSGPAYEQAYAKTYAASLAPLPWPIVGNRIKESKSSAQIVSQSLILGSIQAAVERALAKSHQLSNELAWGLITARVNLKDILPLKPVTVALLTKDVAANNQLKPDIWEAREVTLTPQDLVAGKLTPVNVAIWDSGIDLSLFANQTYTDPHPEPQFDPHGLAFDVESRPTHGNLFPLTPDQAAQYPAMVNDLKGLSDLQLSIDSPEADGLKKELAAKSPADISTFLENLELYANYSHGTHVAGIAARGNPAIRLAAARLTFDYHNVPIPPTDELLKRSAESMHTYAQWFRDHHIRVVNMSWGGGPEGFESDLEKNGIGKDAAERKAMANRFYKIFRDSLYDAIKSDPEVLFICAAGNADSNSAFDETVPSSLKLPNLLTVGAVDQAGDEASFTSYGDTVRVDANGYQVLSTLPGGYKVRFSGTSMASPNTVNLAAKLIAIDPKLTPPQVIDLIVRGATPSEDNRRHNIDPQRSVELLTR